MGYLKENSRIKEDTAMGIVFSGMFAIGLVMFTKIQTEQHLTHILFGNVLGVSHQELIQSAVISAIIFCLIVFKRKDFCFIVLIQATPVLQGFLLKFYIMVY